MAASPCTHELPLVFSSTGVLEPLAGLMSDEERELGRHELALSCFEKSDLRLVLLLSAALFNRLRDERRGGLGFAAAIPRLY